MSNLKLQGVASPTPIFFSESSPKKKRSDWLNDFKEEELSKLEVSTVDTNVAEPKDLRPPPLAILAITAHHHLTMIARL